MSKPKPWEAWNQPHDPAAYARRLEVRRIKTKLYDTARRASKPPSAGKASYPKRGGKYA